VDGTHPTLLRLRGYGIPSPRGSSGHWRYSNVAGSLHRACRGGGEFGEDWHNAGKQATQTEYLSDLIACAEYLVSKGYTSSPSAIHGGSAGASRLGWR